MNKINIIKSPIIVITGLVFGGLCILAIVSFEASNRKQNVDTVPNESNENVVEAQEELDTNSSSFILPPESRLVALYGSPGLPILGSLGEQSPEESAIRVTELANEYQKHSDEKIIPTFEIITTIAAADRTENGDYSSELSIDKIRPWVEVAKEKNIYVILDLQPGLSDFTTQAKLYEELLRQPHVGLALDPEWRLKDGQRHMKQIGTVDANEVNQTSRWLSELCKAHNLPKKVLLIHQFKKSMISNRTSLETSDPNISWIIQMDGLGAQTTKQETWRTIQRDLPPNIHMGWKNFIDEDKPMLNPNETMLVSPKPYYVSYQ